jgi:acyl-CoA synthetase (NDP forming)
MRTRGVEMTIGKSAGSTPKNNEMLFRSPRTVLSAKSLAIVGASERGRWPSQIYQNLKSHGYQGRIYLINPRQKEIYGERAYPSLRDLPEVVDHAIVIVPAAGVAGVLEDAEAAGVTTATIYSGAMGDGEEPESKKRGAWLKEFLAHSKLRISGPNCMGYFSFREKLFAYPNGDLCKVPAGPVGLVFQSGGNLQFFMQVAADRGLRFSYGISTGNEPDIGLEDFLNYVVDDPETRQIVMFIEGIRRPEAFMAAAGKALAAGKPIIAIKTGKSHAGQEAALSHTGAIAGDYAAYLAMCDRYGIVNCQNMDDMVDTTLAFQTTRRPKGPRIGFVTTSGGTVDLLFDYMESENAVLPPFAPETSAALKPIIQDGISPKNPLDVGIPSTNEAAANWCKIVHDDPNVDIIGFSTTLPKQQGGYGDMTAFSKLLAETTKPILAFGRMIHQSPPEAIKQQQTLDMPFLLGLEPTVRAMKALWFHAERQGKLPAKPSDPKASELTPETLEATLADYGISLPKSHFAGTPAAAAEAAAKIGFPVALKIQSADILHKTEAGGVILGLANAAAVKAAAHDLLASAAASHKGAKIDGFLVQEMVSGVEAIAGARNDALYGPMLLVGSGGILVELLKDAELVMLPVTQQDVSRMIDKLKLAKLLSGYRGKPAADRKAMEKAIAGLAKFFLDHRAVMHDIEINPLIVKPDGQGAVAVDVRVIWK